MLPTPSKPWLERRPCATPVGEETLANTGRVGAKLRGACFAGKPAPTGASRLVNLFCNDKAAARHNPEGVGCQVAALRSAAQKRPGRPGYSFKQVPV
ncbi:hypothetical protein DBL05_04845 [Pseudomonas putida]|nr:hypothetical protein DBL05_04845 [Pseudomonas putida]